MDCPNIVLLVLNKYRCTLKLKKFIFYKVSHSFVVIKVYNHGNTMAKVNMDDFSHINALIIFFDVHILILIFCFYANWTPTFEIFIFPLHKITKQNPQATNRSNFMPLEGLWNKGILICCKQLCNKYLMSLSHVPHALFH